MFTVEDRERLRTQLVAELGADPRVSGVALTGSASLGKEDRWSDIDLACGVRDAAEIPPVLEDCSARMVSKHGAVHHVDVLRDAWIYRVFLLANSMQVDLAFAPAGEFRARALSFKLISGDAGPPLHRPPPSAESLIGMAWLYALHVRSSLARGRVWQAEYMISGVRDHVLALACLRHHLPTADGRGFDQLPAAERNPGAIVASLEPQELARAYRIVMDALQIEIERVDAALAKRLAPTLELLTQF